MKTISKQKEKSVWEKMMRYDPSLDHTPVPPVVQAKLEKAREDFKKAPFPEHLLRK